MSVDVSTIETEVLQALAGLVLIGLGLAVNKLLAWLKLKVSDARKSSLQDIADKCLDYAISVLTAFIAEKGWDHIEVRDKVLATAAVYAQDQFAQSLKQLGVNPQTTAKDMAGILERRFPVAATIAVASPVTPPAPSNVPTGQPK